MALHVELLQEARIAEGVMEGYALRMEEAQGIVGGRGVDIDAGVDLLVGVRGGVVAADVGAVSVGVGKAVISVDVAAATASLVAISIDVVSLRIF